MLLEDSNSGDPIHLVGGNFDSKGGPLKIRILEKFHFVGSGGPGWSKLSFVSLL